jgi:dolichyl-phosphate-mannose--protein O-mannosyl transferase
MERNDYLAAVLLAASAASIVVTIVLVSLGVYFFFFFLPVTFGLPWSIRRLFGKRKQQHRQSWEDLR